MNVRFATNDEGLRVAELLDVSGFTIDDLDWSEIYPNWLIAEENEEVIGCLQIIPSKPVGWLELLSLERNMGKKRKARAVKALVSNGAALLKGMGAQVAMGVIPADLGEYIKVLEHRGAREANRGIILAKRL